MKLQPLYDLQEEINRIYVAGSKLSAGDPRLQRHIPIFNKLGEKVPVFAWIAAGLDDLLVADKETSAEKLIAVSILLYSVLYTQGETIQEGLKISEQVPTIDLDDLATNSSYLEIKPIVEALTSTGSGRYEVVMDAFERKVLNDSRLYQYVDTALGDKYSELSTLIETRVIPSIGSSMLPILLKNFAIEATKEQEKRFRAILKIGFEGVEELCHQVLQSSCTDMQVDAIAYLGHNPENEDLLISMLDEKNTARLKAVCIGLANIGTESANAALVEAYLKNKTKSKIEAYTTALAMISVPSFFNELFDKAKAAYRELDEMDITDEKQVKAADVKAFSNYLYSLSKSKKPEALFFFKEVLLNKNVFDLESKKGFYSYEEPIYTPISDSVKQYPKELQLEFYSTLVPELKKKHSIANNWVGMRLKQAIVDYFTISTQIGLDKAMIYDRFSESYIKKDLTFITLMSVFYEKPYNSYYPLEPNLINRNLIDTRWIDLFFKQLGKKLNDDDAQLLYFLSAYDAKSPKLLELLAQTLKKVDLKNPMFSTVGISILMTQDKTLVDQLLNKLKSEIVQTKIGYLRYYNMWNMIDKVPKEYLGDFVELATTYEGKPEGNLFSDIADRISRNN